MDCVICGFTCEELEDGVCDSCGYIVNERIDARIQRAQQERSDDFIFIYLFSGIGPAAVVCWFLVDPIVAAILTVASVPATQALIRILGR